MDTHMKKYCESIKNIIDSIANEENGLSNIYNAESMKIKAAACLLECGKITPEEAIDIQKSVEKILKVVLKAQMLLQFKLDSVVDKHYTSSICKPSKIKRRCINDSKCQCYHTPRYCCYIKHYYKDMFCNC